MALCSGSIAVARAEVTTAQGPSLLDMGKPPSRSVGSPATAVPRDASAVPGACPQSQAGSDSDQPQETVLQGPAPSHQPGTDLRWDVPVPRLSPGRGQGPCRPCAEQDRDTTHSRGAKGARQTWAVGTRGPIPLSPGQDSPGCAPAAACTHLGEDTEAVWVQSPHTRQGGPWQLATRG